MSPNMLPEDLSARFEALQSSFDDVFFHGTRRPLDETGKPVARPGYYFTLAIKNVGIDSIRDKHPEYFTQRELPGLKGSELKEPHESDLEEIMKPIERLFYSLRTGSSQDKAHSNEDVRFIQSCLNRAGWGVKINRLNEAEQRFFTENLKFANDFEQSDPDPTDDVDWLHILSLQSDLLGYMSESVWEKHLEQYGGYAALAAHLEMEGFRDWVLQPEALQNMLDSIRYDYTHRVDLLIEAIEQYPAELARRFDIDDVSDIQQKLEHEVEVLKGVKKGAIRFADELEQFAEDYREYHTGEAQSPDGRFIDDASANRGGVVGM